MMRWSWKENVLTLFKITVVYGMVWLVMPLMFLRPALSAAIDFAFYTLLAFFVLHLSRCRHPIILQQPFVSVIRSFCGSELPGVAQYCPGQP